jgi:hypothetical protein
MISLKEAAKVYYRKDWYWTKPIRLHEKERITSIVPQLHRAKIPVPGHKISSNLFVEHSRNTYLIREILDIAKHWFSSSLNCLANRLSFIKH